MQVTSQPSSIEISITSVSSSMFGRSKCQRQASLSNFTKSEVASLDRVSTIVLSLLSTCCSLKLENLEMVFLVSFQYRIFGHIVVMGLSDHQLRINVEIYILYFEMDSQPESCQESLILELVVGYFEFEADGLLDLKTVGAHQNESSYASVGSADPSTNNSQFCRSSAGVAISSWLDFDEVR